MRRLPAMSVLQWARAHGCPYGMLTVQGAREAMLQEEIAPRYPDWDVTLDEIPEEFEVSIFFFFFSRVTGGGDLLSLFQHTNWAHRLSSRVEGAPYIVMQLP
mmetsp:Transcript_29278/g.73530  ORF Transcript_29278/g.73530 Transcript_29278/m.73530 type:complete len:102 (-) Transcript_29278:19-324(-)